MPTAIRKRKKTKSKQERETKIQAVVNYYFYTKGLSLDEIKKNARKRKIVYSRFVRPAKQLLTLAGSLKRAQEAIKRVAEWAQSRGLDYAIETVFKKWLELDRLQPKEIVKKPFYDDQHMVWSETHKRWYVIDASGEWREFGGEETDIEWRMIR